jgi:flagellar basal-body rod protein FlgC
MSMFGGLDASASGMNADQTWLTAIGDNIANANDTSPTSSTVFPVEEVVVTPASSAVPGPGQLGDGVVVSQIVGVDPQGQLESDPQNPQADSKGMVRGTAVDLGGQMVDMIQAQSSYQSNVSAFTQARDAYASALKMSD